MEKTSWKTTFWADGERCIQTGNMLLSISLKAYFRVSFKDWSKTKVENLGLSKRQSHPCVVGVPNVTPAECPTVNLPCVQLSWDPLSRINVYSVCRWAVSVPNVTPAECPQDALTSVKRFSNWARRWLQYTTIYLLIGLNISLPRLTL